MLLDLRVCFETIKEYEYKKVIKKLYLPSPGLKLYKSTSRL